MRGVILLVLAAVLGGFGYWGISTLLERGEDAKTPAPAVASSARGAKTTPGAPEAPASKPAAPAAKPATSPKLAEPSPAGKSPALRGPLPKFFTGTPNGSAAPPPKAEPDGAKVVSAVMKDLERDRRLAAAAMDSGETERGRTILRQIFAVYKDRADVDVTPEVKRLLEKEQDPERRSALLEYVARHDTKGLAFDDELRRCVRAVAVADTNEKAAYQAWDAISSAYFLARDEGQRKRVTDILDPFIDKFVFSGRFTPLLKSYTVQQGDVLARIASKFDTTVDAIQRINHLKSANNIQPRQRIRILPGRLKIFVDKSEFTLRATIGGRIFREFRVGLGKDNATPTGTFSIAVRQKDPAWFRPGEPSIPAGDPRNVLGTRWLGFRETRDYAGFGIHGTSDPSDLGTESSAGCVRLRKDDIELLFDFVQRGTEVVIRQ